MYCVYVFVQHLPVPCTMLAGRCDVVSPPRTPSQQRLLIRFCSSVRVCVFVCVCVCVFVCVSASMPK